MQLRFVSYIAVNNSAILGLEHFGDFFLLDCPRVNVLVKKEIFEQTGPCNFTYQFRRKKTPRNRTLKRFLLRAAFFGCPTIEIFGLDKQQASLTYRFYLEMA